PVPDEPPELPVPLVVWVEVDLAHPARDELLAVVPLVHVEVLAVVDLDARAALTVVAPADPHRPHRAAEVAGADHLRLEVRRLDQRGREVLRVLVALDPHRGEP